MLESRQKKKTHKSVSAYLLNPPDHVSLVGNFQAVQSVAHIAFSSSNTVLQLQMFRGKSSVILVEIIICIT